MSSLRLAAALALVSVLLVSSGCIGFLTGDEPLSFEAETASVTESALSETGYEEVNRTEVPVTRTVEAGGQSREVQVTNQLVQYQRSLDLGITEQRAAVFVVLSTPRVDVLGRTFNPVGDMSNRELLRQLQSQYSSIQVGARQGRTTVSTLGTEATVDRFAGTARIGGVDVQVFIHVTKIEHGDDFVVAVGVYPQQLPDEGERVLTLVRNLRHGA